MAMRGFAQGLRSLLGRDRVGRDVADEIEHYLAESAASYRAEGLSENEARRRAQLDVGSRTSVRQQVREAHWESRLESWIVDLRRAARRLRRAPGFAAVAVSTLALGIGASTVMVSTVRPVLLEALPYPGADRLVSVSDVANDGSPLDVTFGTYRELSARNHAFQSMTVTGSWQPTLTGRGAAERLEGQRVAADYFRVLGVAPAIGRDFTAADDQPGSTLVAIVSDGLWKQRLGGDPGVIGQTLMLDGVPVTVVGVMPRSFENVWNPDAGIWRPLQYDPTLPADGREWGHHLQLLARLRAGTGLDAAREDIAAIARRPVDGFARPGWATLQGGLLVSPLQEQITRHVRPALNAVITATLLLLVIAGINVVILMLARGAERRTELSTCAAFGASRGRLLTPVLAEGIILAVVGGGLGVALAYAGVGLLAGLDGVQLPRLAAIQVDPIALAFAAALSIGIGCAAAAVPAVGIWRGSGAPLTGIRVVNTHHQLRRGFVVVEVALALVLLIGAGLLVRTVQRLMAVPVGFRPGGVLSLQIQASGPRFRDANATRRYFEQVRAAVQGISGVADVALTSQLPLSGDAEVYGVTTRENLPLPESGNPSAFRYSVSPAYFAAMGIPVIHGRPFDERDRDGSTPVAVISASMAAHRFAGREAIGEQLGVGSTDDPWLTVVGVVGDVRQVSLATAPEDAVYEVASQRRRPPRAMWIVVHTTGDSATLAPSIRRVISGIDADQPIVRVATMEQRMASATGRQRFVMTAFEAFALVALLLATIGIYGVLSGGVVERTREIAVRAAVGASARQVMALILRQAAVVVATGIAIGGLASAAIGRMLASLLFEVSPLDAVTYVGVAGVLLLAAAAGGFVPAWRASRIAPATALQS